MRNNPHIGWWRRLQNAVMIGVAASTAILVTAPLLAIFVYLVLRGATSLNRAFLTHRPTSVGEAGGGMGNAIVGSGIILGIASLIGVPIGVGAGTYIAEYGRGALAQMVRFTADLLNGVPSIVIGISVWALIVVRYKFSALAGGVALGVMMIPTITRSTEEMLLMVPRAVREAALGLGIARWRSTLSITLRTAMPGVITGIMLAFARVAGETAPLLFTAFGNAFWNFNPLQPTAALPLQIYTYANSPYDDWYRQAWAGALVLIILIVGTVAAVRLLAARNTFQAS